MSPEPSTARLGIQRQRPSLPLSKICCCTGAGAIVFPVTFSCAHWIAVGEADEVRTACATQIDSVPERFLYCACIIGRSSIASRLPVEPKGSGGCGTIAPAPNTYWACETFVAALTVPVAGLDAQLTA